MRTVGDARVELIMEDGHHLAIAPAQSVRLDDNVAESDQRPTAQDSAVTTPATADAVIQALERGTDLNQSLEATAAGLAPGGGVDGGSTFVQLLRIAEGVTPLAYEYGFVPPELLPDVEVIPEPVVEPGVSVGVTVGTQVGVGEGEPGLITGDIIQGTVSTADVIEGSGGGGRAVTFLITLDKVSTTDVTVTYTIVPGTATNPADYFDGAATGTVTIPAGYIGFTVTENIVGDILVEGNETFTIVLSNPIGATLINDTATVTIIDDDHAPVAIDDSNSLTEDQISVSGNVLPNDTDVDGQTLSVVGPSISVTNAFGTLVIDSATGAYTFTVNEATQAAAQALDDGESINMVFPDVYQVTDGANLSNLADVSITITGTNDGPTITADPGNPEGGNDVVYESGLAAGSDAAASSEFAFGTFTVSDADGLDDIQSVTINGVTVAIGSLVGQSFAGTNGTLTVTAYDAGTGIASYTYELTSPTTDVVDTDETDVFTLTTSDGTATSAPAAITIEIIDDVPTARADADSVTEGADATGNVLTGAGTTGGAAGADTAGADGFGTPTVVGVAAGSNTAVPVSGGVGGGIAGTYGTLTLNADGSYTYAANPDAVTSNQTDTFVYTIVDGDGDQSTTTLTISVNNVTVTASDTDALVNEAGLPVVGSNAASDSEIFNGAITPSGGSGPYIYTLTSSANGAYGNLVLNADGTYTYTLDTTYDGATADNGVTTEQDKDSFSYTVTDANGNSTTGTILVDIIDDVPTARADADSVAEGADATGNVLTGAGTTGGAAGADTAGADGFGTPTVVGVAAGSNTAVPVSGGVGGAGIAGTYGTLTLNADGSYTYAANPDAVTSNQTDTFVYTIVDGDGDQSTTTLTISVNNVTVTASDTDALVNEAGLPVVGSNAASDSEIFNGAITPSGGSGPYIYTLTSSANGAYGNLVLNADGTYTYTLDTTYDGATADNGVTTEQDKDSFSYTVTDANGNSTTGTILVDIIDDVPTARADADSVAEGADATGNVLTGAGTTGGAAGADTAGADGFGTPTVVGVAAGSNTAVPVSGGVGGGIAGTYGTLTLNADGSYTYAANPDAVTSNQTDTFVYTIVDGDGDQSTTTLTISVNNVTVTASDTDALVNEAGLPVVGSNAASDSEIFNGAITPSGGSGPYIYTLTSSANGAYGNLVLNADGTYTYTLDTTYDGATADNGVTTEQDKDSFSYTVTDANGNSTTGTILVDIIDDVPTARADADSVAEGRGCDRQRADGRGHHGRGGGRRHGRCRWLWYADGGGRGGGQQHSRAGVRRCGRSRHCRHLRHADAERGRQLHLRGQP
ncbi:retention module-containing protein [Polaromonas sp. P1(28)-8]|nr:retention module-containing protein [Polaromonas sp. P1(28)-8]